MTFFKNLIKSIMSGEFKGRYFRSKEFGVLHKDINKAVVGGASPKKAVGKIRAAAAP